MALRDLRGLVAALVAGAWGAAAAPPSFEEYLKQQALSYSGDELAERRRTYESAVKSIEAHNSQSAVTWRAGVNHFTVMTESEKELSLGSVPWVGDPGSVGHAPRIAERHLATSFDWRDRRPSIATPVKNQGSCGSCWAFAATAVLESSIALATGALFDLSTQQITSCAPNPEECGGTGGCDGATAALAFNYTISAGLTTHWRWPYTSGNTKETGECLALEGKKTPVAGITGYQQVPRNDAAALMQALMINPVAVSVAATGWHSYESGIFDACNRTHPILNHGVVLMGYGEDSGTHYWLARNSWGVRWGEYGYIRLLRLPGDEPCGEDILPLHGYVCKDNAPDSITACGMCGILVNGAYPTGAHLGPPDEDGPEDTAGDDARRNIVSEFQITDAEIGDASQRRRPAFAMTFRQSKAPLMLSFLGCLAGAAGITGLLAYAVRRRQSATPAAAYLEVGGQSPPKAGPTPSQAAALQAWPGVP